MVIIINKLLFGIILIINLLFFAFYLTFANDTKKPVINKEYTIQYNPKSNNIFINPFKLHVYYTFDYWDNPLTKKTEDNTTLLRCKNSKRKKINEMIKKDSIWESTINVPLNAKILSYVITDGSSFDLNNGQTFFDYIYDDNLKPVREACVYMAQLRRLTHKDPEMAYREIEKEIENYPANFTAYYFYWQLFLYKELFKKEAINKVETDIQNLLTEYPWNPEICNLAVKVYNSGLVKTDKLFSIIEKIPSNCITDELKNYIRNERSFMDLKRGHDSLLNSKAPDFVLDDIMGNKVKLSNYYSKVVLLYFWILFDKSATWNYSSLDSIQVLQNRFMNKDLQIFVIYSLRLYNKKENYDIKEFLNEHKYNLTFLSGNEYIYKLYFAQGFSFYLIDKKGTIRYTYDIGRLIKYKDMLKNVEKLLKD